HHQLTAGGRRSPSPGAPRRSDKTGWSRTHLCTLVNPWRQAARRRTVSIQKRFWIDTEIQEEPAVGATLQTIADELNISRSTVSNAYSRPDQLSPELRSRILETAERLGYPGPNPSARSLRRGKAGAIGVVLTSDLSMAFSDPYAVAYLRGLAQAAEQKEASLLLITIPSDEEAAIRTVRSAAVDGFCVYCVAHWHPALDVIRSRGLPMVVNERPATESGAMFVGIDEREASRKVGEHIANLGHERIAIVADSVRYQQPAGVVTGVTPEDLRYYVTGERVRGFRDALEKGGVPWEK